MTNINITPNAAKLIESLRHLTYTNEAAIADIVDNSFDAGANDINVITERGEDPYILITDDGCGMDLGTMQEAIKLGSDTEKDQTDLGRFGMGLVTAGISMGRRIEVISKVDGGEPGKVALDLDHIVEAKEWEGSIEELTEEEQMAFESREHGTFVRICKLDSVKANVGAATARHLRRVFRSFLAAGKSIAVNYESLTPIDPLARDMSDTEIWEDDIDVDGSKVHIVVAHIDTDKSELASKREDPDHLTINSTNQGFYIMRNSREIANAETLGLYERHPSKNRFRCEISYTGNLDKQFGINFMKRRVNVSQSLADKIMTVVRPYLSMIGKQGERDEQVSKSEEIDHNDAEGIIKRKKALLNTRTRWNEKHKKPTHRVKDEEKKEEEEESTDKKTRKREHVRKIQFGNRAMPAEIREADLGVIGPMFDACFEGNKIVVRWNIRHPFHTQVVAKFSSNKNVITPIDLLIYSLAQEQLSLDESDPDVREMAQALNNAVYNMSNNLRILMQ